MKKQIRSDKDIYEQELKDLSSLDITKIIDDLYDTLRNLDKDNDPQDFFSGILQKSFTEIKIERYSKMLQQKREIEKKEAFIYIEDL